MGIILKISQKIFNYRIKHCSLEKRLELMRNKFFFCGNNIKLYTHYFGTEPYLISIHDNVTCAADVKFINHDVSVWNVSRFLGKPHISLDKVGAIELYENSFVGAFSILMPNTSIGRNSILAAGSVLTKHIPAGEVWGGAFLQNL